MKAFVAGVVGALTLFARPAAAFYTRGYFERPAARGGAGGLYYTGSARERGWDCKACHERAPGAIRVSFETDPPDLIATRRYSPELRYQITVVLEAEHLGFDSQFNSNGFVAEFSRSNTRVGTLAEGPGTELAANGRIVLSRNDTNGLARWTFRWTAPIAGTGAVLVNLGAVDGDGAGRTDRSFQDHLNDDVFVGDLVLDEGTLASQPAPASDRRFSLAAAVPARRPEPASNEPVRASLLGGSWLTGGLLGAGLVLALALWTRRRRA